MSETATEDYPAEATEPFRAPEGVEDEPDTESSTDEPDAPQEASEGQETTSTERVATPEELEQQRAKLQRSATTWRNRVSDVLGEDAQILVPCELCEPDIPGFHFPPEVMRPYDDVQARLVAVLTEPGAPDYRAASDVRQCDNCDGYGKVVTGSRVPGQETKACATCSGFGYMPPPGATQNGPVSANTAPVAVGVPGQPGVVDDADAWGSPRVLPDGQLNPNYGKMPQYKDASLP